MDPAVLIWLMAREYFHRSWHRELEHGCGPSCIFFSKFRRKLSNAAAVSPFFFPPEWFDSGSNSKLLQDLDNSSVMEDGRKKLNTVFHYQVCACERPLWWVLPWWICISCMLQHQQQGCWECELEHAVLFIMPACAFLRPRSFPWPGNHSSSIIYLLNALQGKSRLLEVWQVLPHLHIWCPNWCLLDWCCRIKDLSFGRIGSVLPCISLSIILTGRQISILKSIPCKRCHWLSPGGEMFLWRVFFLVFCRCFCLCWSSLLHRVSLCDCTNHLLRH